MFHVYNEEHEYLKKWPFLEFKNKKGSNLKEKMTETNFEVILKILGLFSLIYLFLQIFIPLIQNLMAQGFAGAIIVVFIIWWLSQKNK